MVNKPGGSTRRIGRFWLAHISAQELGNQTKSEGGQVTGMVFQIGQIVVHMSEPCLPKHSSTAVVIGQDLGSEQNYTAAVGAHAHPFGLMSYISLRIGPDGEIEGLESPTDYGSGVEWVLGILDHYQLSALQLGLWLIDSFDKLPTHEFDRNLAQLGKFIASTGRPFYIRIGYEFESVANHYPPDQYVAAFRYVVDYFRSSKVTNVHYVWHAAGFAVRDGLSYDAWYPGRDYVDWCGVSLFQQPYHCGQQIDCPTMLHADEFATYCKERGIPMMIAESAPFGGIVEPTEDSITAGNKTNEAGFVGASWSEWFEPVLAYIDRHDVRLWSYINCNWDAQQMWQEQHAPGEQWGDTRIEGMRSC